MYIFRAKKSSTTTTIIITIIKNCNGYVAAWLLIPRQYPTVCVLVLSMLGNQSGAISRLDDSSLFCLVVCTDDYLNIPHQRIRNVLFFFSLGWPLSPAVSIKNESLIKPGFFAGSLLQGSVFFLACSAPTNNILGNFRLTLFLWFHIFFTLLSAASIPLRDRKWKALLRKTQPPPKC